MHRDKTNEFNITKYCTLLPYICQYYVLLHVVLWSNEFITSYYYKLLCMPSMANPAPCCRYGWLKQYEVFLDRLDRSCRALYSESTLCWKTLPCVWNDNGCSRLSRVSKGKLWSRFWVFPAVRSNIISNAGYRRQWCCSCRKQPTTSLYCKLDWSNR